jgi:hypothetical protein
MAAGASPEAAAAEDHWMTVQHELVKRETWIIETVISGDDALEVRLHAEDRVIRP